MATKPNVSIKVGRDEPIEKAIKRFKRLCEKQGIKKQVKSRRYYEKPSEKRRSEVRKADRNRKKADRDDKGKTKYNKNNNNWMFNHPKLSEE